MWHKHSGTKWPDAAATSGSLNAPGRSPTSPAATPIAPSVNACANTPAPLVLIVDDFAMREHTPTESDDLYDLVSDRAIAAKPLILTSNRAPKDWYPLFPNPVVAESLLDRLINTSHQVLMDGPSYRPRKRPGTSTT